MDLISEMDLKFMEYAVEIALKAEQNGNLPIGSVIVLNGGIISEGTNAIHMPEFHPGKHAEMEALKDVPIHLWPESSNMICYSTLEPCLMCFGSLLLHGIGKIVFGALDREGGAGSILNHLPSYYNDKANIPDWIGSILPDICDPLYKKAAEEFEKIPNR